MRDLLFVVSVGDALLNFDIVQYFVGDLRVIAMSRVIGAEIDYLSLELFGDNRINDGHFVFCPLYKL
jgi:hypothetical protein